MQAIITRYLCQTNTKPARIVAQCLRARRVYSAASLVTNEAESGESAHIEAAKRLCDEFVLEDQRRYGTKDGSLWGREFSTGCLPSQDYVHVFIMFSQRASRSR